MRNIKINNKRDYILNLNQQTALANNCYQFQDMSLESNPISNYT